MNNTNDDGIITELSAQEREEIIAGATAEMAYWRDAPARFFKAWKQGVALAGVGYFGDGSKAGFLAATDKNDLAPRMAVVKEALGVLSGGERTFLVAMYSFYNGRTAADMWEENFQSPDNIGTTISGLDLARRRVLAELTLTYTGW